MTEPEPCRVFLIGRLKIGARGSPEFEEYSRRSNRNGEAHGGVVVQKIGIARNAGPGPRPDFLLVVEYPSRTDAIRAFSSPEYKRITRLRDAVFADIQILISND